MPRMICYTAITGGYDDFDRTLARANPGWECWLLTDRLPFWDLEGWRHRRLPKSELSPRMQARRCKILAHEMFPSAAYTVWLDGNLRLKPHLKLNNVLNLRPGSWFVTAEHGRGCVYKEAAECLRLGLDDPAVIQRQVRRYRLEGLPADAGLYETRMIVREHNDCIRDLNLAWWAEVEGGCCRDQVALPYAVWKEDRHVTTISGQTFHDTFTVAPHVGRRVPG